MLLKKCSWARTRAGGTMYFSCFSSRIFTQQINSKKKIVTSWIHLKGTNYSTKFKIIREISIYCFVLDDIVSIVSSLVSQIGQ